MLDCTKCKKKKDPLDFSPRKNRPRGYSSWCKKCQTSSKMAQYRSANRDVIKDGKLRASFGITLVEYNALLLSQGNKCAICNKPEVVLSKYGEVKALAVDHCHATGDVRGLLCQKCNQALGLFNDDIDTLISAINYLKEKI